MRGNLSAAPFPVWEGAAHGLYAVRFRCGDGAGIAAVERGGDVSKALAIFPWMHCVAGLRTRCVAATKDLTKAGGGHPPPACRSRDRRGADHDCATSISRCR